MDVRRLLIGDRYCIVSWVWKGNSVPMFKIASKTVCHEFGYQLRLLCGYESVL